MSETVDTEVVVLGSGPAGYSAAFRAADLGLDTVLVERYPSLGGVCLNVGCIPSKALLHLAKVIKEAKGMSSHGINFGDPTIDLKQVREWKDEVVGQLTKGLDGMAKQRKARIVNGLGKFNGPNSLVVQGAEGVSTVNFQNAIIAVGSRPIKLPFIPHDDPRIWDSTDALELKEIPPRLLLMGGGIIGLEMGMVYQALGSRVEVVEMLDQVIPAADKDVVGVFTRATKSVYNYILETKVTSVSANENSIEVTFEDKNGEFRSEEYDAVLVAIGRAPNGAMVGAEQAGLDCGCLDYGHVGISKLAGESDEGGLGDR